MQHPTVVLPDPEDLEEMLDCQEKVGYLEQMANQEYQALPY